MPKKSEAERPLTPEENRRFRELAVILTKEELLTNDMDDAEAAEVVRRLEAWIRAPGAMPWMQVRHGPEDRTLRAARRQHRQDQGRRRGRPS